MSHIESNWGVIFDMDGVLVDSADAHFRSWQALAEENGRAISRDQFAVTFGRQNRDIIPMLFGEVPSRRLADLSERKEAIYRELVRERVPIIEGARELIVNLHAAGARLAIGSSGPPENIQLVLDTLGVSELFDAIISAKQVTRGKPDPQVFQLACEALRLPGYRCVIVEDAPAGVAAAIAAGTKVVAILIHHEAAHFAEFDLAVEKLCDLSVLSLRDLLE